MFDGALLKEERKLQKMTQSELGKKANISSSYISDIEKNRYNPSVNTLTELANALGVTIDRFFRELENRNIHKIPVFSAVSAGYPLLANDQIIDYEEIPLAWKSKGEFFGIRIKGDSMSPRYLEGDTIVVQKQTDIESGELGIVLINGDESVFKKVEKKENGIVLISLNPAYSPRFFTAEDIKNLPVQIIGRVVELRGKV